MTPRDGGSGRKPPNRGGRGFCVEDKSLPNTNIPPLFVLPTTMKSTHPIYEGPPFSTFHEQGVEHHVGEPNLTVFPTEPTMNQPSPIQDTLTLEYEFV